MGCTQHPEAVDLPQGNKDPESFSYLAKCALCGQQYVVGPNRERIDLKGTNPGFVFAWLKKRFGKGKRNG